MPFKDNAVLVIQAERQKYKARMLQHLYCDTTVIIGYYGDNMHRKIIILKKPMKSTFNI